MWTRTTGAGTGSTSAPGLDGRAALRGLPGRDEILTEGARLTEQALEIPEGTRPMALSGLRGVGKAVPLDEFCPSGPGIPAVDSHQAGGDRRPWPEPDGRPGAPYRVAAAHVRGRARAGEVRQGAPCFPLLPAQRRSDRNLQLWVRCRSGTGLPSLPSVLAEATSYAGRLCDYRPLGLLSDGACSVTTRQRMPCCGLPSRDRSMGMLPRWMWHSKPPAAPTTLRPGSLPPQDQLSVVPGAR